MRIFIKKALLFTQVLLLIFISQSFSAQNRPNQRLNKSLNDNLARYDSIYTLTEEQKIDFLKIAKDHNMQIKKLNNQFLKKGREIKKETRQTRKEIRKELRPEFNAERLKLLRLRDARIYFIFDERQRALMDQRREKQGYKELLIHLKIISS